MTLTLRYAARSHTGLLREGNEDSVYAGPRLLAVADGMGGHAAGEVASAVAIAAIAGLDEDAPGPDLLAALLGAAKSANRHLHDMVEGDAALDGMGTTLTAILWGGSRLGLLHIGDSRAYLLREGELSQITHDHTLVQSLVDAGRISADEAEAHPQRNVITKVLDGREDLDPDLSVREVRAGDRYLLCSDGLTGPVGSTDTLRDALSEAEPQAAVDRLVQLALRGGGPDNITVVVADAIETDHPLPAEPVVAGAAAEAPQAPPPGSADSAASRARTAEGRDVEAPRPSTSAPVSDAPRRHGRRLAVLATVVALLLLAGAGAGYAYVRSQYYVGADGQTVAVFRGVAGEVAGVDLSSLEERSDLRTDQLGELDAARVEKGIVAKDKDDARQILARLKTLACPTPAVTTSPQPTPQAVPPAGASAAPTPTISVIPAPVPSSAAGCP
ncbi:MAG: protein phosphatase 2C domain-containing protein [Frankiaceae bacterium]|nr:protein phosphatase 2C domain-containing protein [Frankiaceae bacterium]